MKALANKTSLFFYKLPDTLSRNKLLVWGLFLLASAVMFAGLPRVRTDASVLSYFQKNEPIRKAYDQYRSAFGGDELLYIAYEAKDGDVFSDASLKALQGIQAELLNYRLQMEAGEKSPLDHIEDVTTLLNVSYLESSNDTLISREFIGSKLPHSDNSRNAIRQTALREKNIPQIYFSEDSRFGGIVIETDYNAIALSENEGDAEFAETDEKPDMNGEFAAPDSMEAFESAGDSTMEFNENVMADYVPFMDEVKKIIQKPEYSRHLKFYPVGTPAFMDFIYVMVLGEMGMIILGMILLVILTTGLLYRSVSAMLWSVLSVVFSLIWTMGTIGWSGVVMPDLIIVVVFFVIAVCIADTIHILSGYLFFRQQKQCHRDALKSVYKKSGFACLLTSITTAIGFASMLFVPIVSMQRIGGATAIGIIYAFLITIFILPMMLNMMSPGTRKLKEQAGMPVKLHILQRLLRRIEDKGFGNATLTIILFAVLMALCAPGISRIRIESSNIEILRPDTTIRKAFDIADEHLAGTDSLEILVDTGKPNGMKDFQVLKLMESLQNMIESEFKDTVALTYSVADVVKNAYQALNNGVEDAYIIPKNSEVLTQTLFLFDNADPDDRRELVTDDYRMGRITIFSKSIGTLAGIELMETVEQFCSRNLKNLKDDYPDAIITLTGMTALRTKMYHFVSQSQIIGFGITLCVISIVLLLALGSPKIGLLALIPNLFPMVVVAGLMGYFQIPLDIHTLLVFPIIIGISVDDSIHFLSHFRMARQQHGDTRLAVIGTCREVGQAILFTSVILSIGFLMFMGSKNMGFVYFGILNALAITVAVVADLFLLPAVLAKHYPSAVTRSARINLDDTKKDGRLAADAR